MISKELQDVLDASYRLEEAGRECQATDTIMFELEELMSYERWDDARAFINAVDFDRVSAATILVILSLVRMDASFKAREAAFYQRAQEHIRKLYPDNHTELLQGLQ